jgi:hypothetical protein
MDLRDVPSLFPELNSIPPGPDHLCVQIKRIFVDPIPAQYGGLQQVLRQFPAVSSLARKTSCYVARDYKRIFEQPMSRRGNSFLKPPGVGPLSMPLHNSGIELAEAFMQLTVASFEFPSIIPPSVHFIGVTPINPNQVPLPSWAHQLDGSQKAVLVTQGTVATHFEELVAPILAALANEPDLS